MHWSQKIELVTFIWGLLSTLRKNLYKTVKLSTSSVSPELLHRFARGLAPVAFLRNITLLSINMKVIWRASLLKNCEQADKCNNSGKTEEVLEIDYVVLTLKSKQCKYHISQSTPPERHKNIRQKSGNSSLINKEGGT